MCSYKVDKRKSKLMENLERCYKVVQQSRTGISAIQVAEKLEVHRTTAHSYLNTLELMERVYSQHGLWYAKEEKSRVSGKLLSEIKSENKNRMWQLYGKIIALLTNPQLRYREDGSRYYYHNTFEIIKLIKILVEMHPSIKEEVAKAIKNSELTRHPHDMAAAIKNFGNYLTASEFDQLIGKIGRVINEIEMEGVE